jgi:hypothetical protein
MVMLTKWAGHRQTNVTCFLSNAESRSKHGRELDQCTLYPRMEMSQW